MIMGMRAFALAAGLLVCSVASAELMKNEPADFRGVVWDQPFDKSGEGMTVVRDEGHVKYYKRAGDAQKIGHVDAIKVAYRFYKDQFSSGIVQTYGGANQTFQTDLFEPDFKEDDTNAEGDGYGHGRKGRRGEFYRAG